jgi:phosphatidylserine decarboxylase
MTNVNRYAYVDRKTGAVVSDSIYASKFMEWCYNTFSGNFLTDLILSRGFFSRLYGWYYRQTWTKSKISAFATAMRIDLSELTKPLESFGSFSEFISREINLSQRKINDNPDICVSPVDGRIMVYPHINADSSFCIKNGLFNLRTLLQDQVLADRYHGGALATFRLYLADYHHFHFPVDGLAHESRSIPGRYYATSPYSVQYPVPFYGVNHRMLTLVESERFGLVTLMEIGAFTVGSICQHYSPDERVSKGQHKGWFELGGSSLALLFERNAIRFDSDLCANTEAGIETYVRMGESIGSTQAT